MPLDSGALLRQRPGGTTCRAGSPVSRSESLDEPQINLN